MNPATAQADTRDSRTRLPAFSKLIGKDMQLVERCLADNLRSEVTVIEEMVRTGGLGGGKRFRPMLLLLAARASGEVNRNHILAAAAIEMIHAATLVHDDVIDGAEQRRHQPTVNSRWGTQDSVLFGDFLFTHAFYLASTTADATTCQIIGRATNQVCAGELQQNHLAGNFELDENQYYEIIDKKTAALCGCATYLGAHLANLDGSHARDWESVGRHLGMAFQITDDILDICGDGKSCGKTLGTDLSNGKATLPIILALKGLSPEERSRWVKALTEKSLQPRHFADWLAASGSIQQAHRVASGHVQLANQIVQQYAPSAVAAFDQIGQFLLSRHA